MSCEIALSDPDLTFNLIGPYRSDYTIYRGANIITGGIVTSTNLNKDRQTLMIGGATYEHYYKRRIYPFNPKDYIERDWPLYPKRWRQLDTVEIMRRLVQDMEDEGDGLGTVVVGPNAGFLANYRIFPADPTTMFEHIEALSKMGDKGFEWQVSPVTGETFVYPGGRDSGSDVYHIYPSVNEATGQIEEFDWNNVGPRGTWTMGLGSGDKARKMGAVKTDPESTAQFRRLDKVEDYGEVGSQAVLNKKTAFDGSTNLGPERTLSLAVLNPEFQVPNFYTGGRPRNLIGNRIHAEYDFEYRHIDAHWIVNALKFDIKNSGNEVVGFELEMIPPRLV